MPVKRKRDIMDFDPNKSDSEDENFDPSEDRPRRHAKKKSGSSRGKSSASRRRRARYGGSDIDDDEELSDSAQEDSFEEDQEEVEEDEDAPVNAAGRRTRKAAAQHQNYKESSDESVVEDSDAGAGDMEDLPKKSTQRPSRIIVLKTNPQNLRPKRGGKEPAQATPDPPPYLLLLQQRHLAHSAVVDWRRPCMPLRRRH